MVSFFFFGFAVASFDFFSFLGSLAPALAFFVVDAPSFLSFLTGYLAEPDWPVLLTPVGFFAEELVAVVFF